VAGHKPLDPEGGEGGDGRLDDGLEHGPGQVEAAHEAHDRVAAGEAAGVVEHVDGPGVGAAGHHHVQDRAAAPARLHRDQGREAVLGHQLLVVEEVVGQPDRRTPSAPAARMST
jgi:hypothetical protein